MGLFEVVDSKVVPGSYHPSPNHRLLTRDGFFRLNRTLTERLQQEVTARAGGPGMTAKSEDRNRPVRPQPVGERIMAWWRGRRRGETS